MATALFGFIGSAAKATVVTETTDFSDSVSNPTDLSSTINMLATNDQVVGSVDLSTNDDVDAFAFRTDDATNGAPYQIPYTISNFSGTQNGTISLFSGASGSVAASQNFTVSGDGAGVFTIGSGNPGASYRIGVFAQGEGGTVAYDYQIGVIPEPSTALLIGVAAAAAALRIRRKRN